MQSKFDLIITADSPNHSAELRLLDGHGSQLAYHRTDFKSISASHLHGLFDLRNYLRLYVEEGKEAAAVSEIGVYIAEKVLGGEIFHLLWESSSQRTLRIQLPGASDEENQLSAALARVPWEIARPAADKGTLSERNLLVRVVHDMQAPASQPVELTADEALRVLFVFAEARGSRPLDSRRERLELLRLFEKEIYPHRCVVAHFLTHGVTRERLKEQIQENGGYHVVHWSGHGHLNLLELSKIGGAKDHLSGDQLLELFTEAGGFLPRLVFLSACHSGDILRVKDWEDFLAVAQGKEPGAKSTATKDLDLKEQPGFTGTAHALLHGGVSSVVAMRYAVGDEYARELAVEFYRALLAHAQPKSTAAALTIARQSMRDGKKHDPSRFAVCDHATPILYGTEQSGLTLTNGRSPDLNPRNPRLHKITELSTAGHEHFVGRTWELAALGADFIGSRTGAEVKPMAVITGLGGMGKTALVAEALALWETRFEWVLLYQAKPNALSFEATLRDIHLKLMGELGRYHNHVKARPADAIYRDGSDEFTGLVRLERLISNLVRALKDEPILLVFDNFETNLKEHAESMPAGQPVWACQDPAWSHCLTALAKELVGSPSRVLITCRRPLTALMVKECYPVLLGPLPPTESALFLKAHPTLSRMVFGTDAGEKALALRLLNASRFHPLLMDRLARLALSPALRPQLIQALDILESTKNFARLPALFVTSPGDAKELTYLDDALAVSLDQLILNTNQDARRLLWMIAVANEPVTLVLLKSVWNNSREQQQLRRAEIKPLLCHLVSVGLATEERTRPDDANPELTCHELVRERIRAWMEHYPHDRGELTENAIRFAFAERLEVLFNELKLRNMATALTAGSRALVYYVQAEAWDRLNDFASSLVLNTRDPRLRERLIPHLRTASETVPEGRTRWRCLSNLADALRFDRPGDSLSFYEQAATQARASAEAGGEDSQLAWTDLAAITGNWAGAYQEIPNQEAARQRYLEAAESYKKARAPAVYVITSELECLRIDILQGHVKSALPEVLSRLAQLDAWWKQHRAGQTVPEAPYPEQLSYSFITALDIAKYADYASENWDSLLDRFDTILEVKRALGRLAVDIAGERVGRANVLVLLNRFDEAREELEECLCLFQDDPGASGQVRSSLATLFASQGDVLQAIIQERRALSLCEQLHDPVVRIISHCNLTNWLRDSAAPSDRAESRCHELAALIYIHVSGNGLYLKKWFNNIVIRFIRDHAAGIEPAAPRVAEILAAPRFQPLAQWLRQRQVDASKLQAAVDHYVEQARQTALKQK